MMRSAFNSTQNASMGIPGANEPSVVPQSVCLVAAIRQVEVAPQLLKLGFLRVPVLALHGATRRAAPPAKKLTRVLAFKSHESQWDTSSLIYIEHRTMPSTIDWVSPTAWCAWGRTTRRETGWTSVSSGRGICCGW